MNESKRIFSGFIANGYSQGVTIFSQVVLVPFFISNWGIHLYGDWLVLIALPMYIALSDMGFSASAASRMCMLAGKNRDKEVMTTFVSAWYLSILLAAGLSLLLFLIFLVLQATGTYKFTAITPATARTGFSMYVFYMFLTVLCGSMAAVYKYAQRYSLNIYINNTTRLLESIVTVVMLLLKQDLLVVIAAMIVIRFIGLCTMAVVARRFVPFFSLGMRYFSMEKIRELTASSIHFSLFSTSINLFPQAFLIALGNVFPSEIVVEYTMVKTLSRFGFQVLNSYNSSLTVEISHLTGKQDWGKIFSIVEKSSHYFIAFAVAYIVAGLYMADDIFRWWSRQDLEIDHVLFFLVSATSLVQSNWMLFFSVFSSSNNHGKASKIYCFISLLYLVIVFAAIGPKDLYKFLFLGLFIEIAMLAILFQDYRKYKISKNFKLMTTG
jgi:O-antigen/teichoic acid export membrane protein